MITPGLSSTVVLPQRAYVLDWVFADGPPGNARIYDNNGRQDFHSILPNNMTEEEYWAEEEQRIYTRLLQEWREREEAIRMKVSCNRPIALKSSYSSSMIDFPITSHFTLLNNSSIFHSD